MRSLFAAIAYAFPLLAVAACSSEPAEPTESAPVGPQVVAPHRLRPAPKPAWKQVGDDCTEYGAAACVSGLCLHVSGQRARGYVCSRSCVENSDCPQGWSCRRAPPGAGDDACIPPEE
jgi:hypothetical protein